MIERDYQSKALAEVRHYAAVKRAKRIILQSETGSGKTFMGCRLIEACFEKGNRALWLASGRELVKSASSTLWSLRVPHSVWMRGSETSATSGVIVASKESFESRCMHRKTDAIPPANLLIIDECSTSMAAGWMRILQKYYEAGAILIGLDATPCRADGKGLGTFWEVMVQTVPSSKLIEEGWILPTNVYTPYIPNLKGVKSGANRDYDRRILAERMNRNKLVGDIVVNWKTYGEDKQTICWACDRNHSRSIMDRFRAAGINAQHVDGETPWRERDEALEKFRASEVRILCTVGIANRGVDLPIAACGINARPTRSFPLFRQMVGRLKRPWKDKDYSIFLDHSGATLFHGHPDDDVKWELTGNINDLRKVADPAVNKLTRCPKCFHTFRADPGCRVCPSCGHTFEKRRSEAFSREEDNELLSLFDDDVQVPAFVEKERRQRYWLHCLGVQAARKSTFRAASVMYKSKIGNWPEADSVTPMPDKADFGKKIVDVFPNFDPENRRKKSC